MLKNITSTDSPKSPSSSEGLRRQLLESILLQPLDTNQDVLQLIIGNLHTYVGVVYYQEYDNQLVRGMKIYLLDCAELVSRLFRLLCMVN